MSKLANRFGNFVQWFKRGRRNGPIVNPPAPQSNSGGVMVAEAEIETEESLPSRRPAKESPMDKLQRGYEEMVTLMSSVRNHLETQAERSERLLRVLDGLPEALKSLPEATRNQTRTLEAIQTNLNQQGQHNTRLADALNGLAKSTQHHEHAMSAIGQQLDAGHKRSEQILTSFHTLTGTLDRMTDNNEASTILLRRMAEQESQAAEQVRQLFVRNQKQMTTMSVVSWSLALVALTVAGFVAVSVSKMGTGPMPQHMTPAVNTPIVPPSVNSSAMNTPAPSAIVSPAPGAQQSQGIAGVIPGVIPATIPGITEPARGDNASTPTLDPSLNPIFAPQFEPEVTPGIKAGISPGLTPGLLPGLIPDTALFPPTEKPVIVDDAEKVEESEDDETPKEPEAIIEEEQPAEPSQADATKDTETDTE